MENKKTIKELLSGIYSDNSSDEYMDKNWEVLQRFKYPEKQHSSYLLVDYTDFYWLLSKNHDTVILEKDPLSVSNLFEKPTLSRLLVQDFFPWTAEEFVLFLVKTPGEFFPTISREFFAILDVTKKQLNRHWDYHK
jgi:hypothetical protein